MYKGKINGSIVIILIMCLFSQDVFNAAKPTWEKEEESHPTNKLMRSMKQHALKSFMISDCHLARSTISLYKVRNNTKDTGNAECLGDGIIGIIGHSHYGCHLKLPSFKRILTLHQETKPGQP